MAESPLSKEMGDIGAPPIPHPIPPSPVATQPQSSSPRRMVSQRPSLGPRRTSRFTEEGIAERTPASSISIRSFEPPPSWDGPNPQSPAVPRRVNSNNTQGTNNTITHTNAVDFGPVRYTNETMPAVATVGRGFDEERGIPPLSQLPPPARVVPSNKASWLRILNSCLHVVPCLVLLYIMGASVRMLRGNWVSQTSIQCIILLSFLYLDTILDVIALFRIRKPWPLWRLVLRMVFGAAYLVLFFVYAGFGRVFPEGYAYWGVSTGFAGPLVYIFLWALGVWDLLHLPICRYHLVSRLRKICFAGEKRQLAPPRRPSMVSSELHPPSSFNPRVSTVGTEAGASSISLTWRRWVRTRSTSYSHHGHDQHDVEIGLQRPRTRTTVGDGDAGTLSSSADATLRGEEGVVEREHVEDVEKSREGCQQHSTARILITGKRLEEEEEEDDDDRVYYDGADKGDSYSSNKKADEEGGQRRATAGKAAVPPPPPRAEDIGQ